MMAFETKVRGLIHELIQPILEKSLFDREIIFKMEVEEDKLLQRVDQLEVSVYKQDSITGRTLFDDINDRISDLSVKQNKARAEVVNDIYEKNKKFEN